MVNQIHNSGNGIQAFYESIPPTTRAIATAIFATTCLTSLQIIQPKLLVIYWPWIVKDFQIWRLLSNFVFIGGFSFSWLIQMTWLLKYGATLEQVTFQFNPTDYVFCIFFNMCAMVVLNAAYHYILGKTLMVMGGSLIMSILYLWSKDFPNEVVSIMGLVKIQSFYLPFAFMGITVLMGGSVVPDLFGIIVGHIYHYCTKLYPQQYGAPSLIQTPRWFAEAVQSQGVGVAPQQQAQQTSGWSAFQGRGRRLHED